MKISRLFPGSSGRSGAATAAASGDPASAGNRRSGPAADAPPTGLTPRHGTAIGGTSPEAIHVAAQGADRNGSEQRRACLRRAACLLGASDENAQDFEAQGATVMDGLPLHVIAMGPGDGPWVACMKLARPECISETAWSELLLVANGQAMLVEDWAFGLEDDGDGALLMLLPSDLNDARLLAARLEGMLTMCKSVAAGAEAVRSMPGGVEAKA